MRDTSIKSVAIIGAGASGAVAAAALAAEGCFDRVRVFERRETPGGTWIYDPDPGPPLAPPPGYLPPDIDPPLKLPAQLPATTKRNAQERFTKTPVYYDLTTNVPSIAMSFSDKNFAYGPFVPHWVPKQYIQDYFTSCRTDDCLALNTTVEDIAKLSPKSKGAQERWALTLRQPDPTRDVDIWWREEFDAVILGNGHYSVPFVPHVPGLEEYMRRYPGKVFHSKTYRTPVTFSGKRVLIIGNSASGHDIAAETVRNAHLPVFQSRRSRARFDGDEPPHGIAWKTIISEYDAETGDISFVDGSVLSASEVDLVIYCTGYLPSFPFWNSKANGGPLYDYNARHLAGIYQHTFFRDHPTLGIIGIPKTLTFRSFEYQAVALARLFAGRAQLPSKAVMKRWEDDRAALVNREHRKFHDIPWDNDETADYFQALYDMAGLPQLFGQGRCPPVLDADTRWALENIRKYPEPGKDKEGEKPKASNDEDDGWTLLDECQKDSLHYI